MNGHADTIREALTTYVPPGFRDEDGVWHDGPIQAGAVAALDALLAENQRLREALAAIATKTVPAGTFHAGEAACVAIAREALAGDGE